MRPAETSAIVAAFLLVSKENAINQGVSPLRRFEGFGERFLAAAVDAVGKDNEGFAAPLLFHQFVGGEVNGIVEECAAAVTVTVRASAASAAIATVTGGASAGAGLGELRRMNLIDGGEEFFARGGEVLKEFDFVIEMDEEGCVLAIAKDVIEEGAAGGAFLVEDAALAETGVNEQAEGEREVGLFGEIGDGLGLAVLFEGEVVFGKIADEVTVFVADGGEEIDGRNAESDGRGLLGEEGERGEEEKKHSWKEFSQDVKPCLSADF